MRPGVQFRQKAGQRDSGDEWDWLWGKGKRGKKEDPPGFWSVDGRSQGLIGDLDRKLVFGK